MTMLRRAEPNCAAAAIFADTELVVLERTTPALKPGQTRDLDFYLTASARLGGFLARRHDPPPETIVLWRGFSRLADLVIGFEPALQPDDKTCGQLKGSGDAYASEVAPVAALRVGFRSDERAAGKGKPAETSREDTEVHVLVALVGSARKMIEARFRLIDARMEASVPTTRLPVKPRPIGPDGFGNIE
jgi:hypothetical protein